MIFSQKSAESTQKSAESSFSVYQRNFSGSLWAKAEAPTERHRNITEIHRGSVVAYAS